MHIIWLGEKNEIFANNFIIETMEKTKFIISPAVEEQIKILQRPKTFYKCENICDEILKQVLKFCENRSQMRQQHDSTGSDCSNSSTDSIDSTGEDIESSIDDKLFIEVIIVIQLSK